MYSFIKSLMVTTCFVIFGFGIGVHASALEVLVTDGAGNPLNDAVVEFVVPGVGMKAGNKPLIVDQVDKSFLPKVLVAPVNSRVNFPNSDEIRHHVYSFSEAKTFQLKLYAGEPKEPILFDKTGLVVLGCNIHDSMVGYIYVSESPAYLTGQDGMVQIDRLPANIEVLTVWHPDAEQGVHFRKNVNLSTAPNNKITIQMSINPPEPRNTFEDVFGYD